MTFFVETRWNGSEGNLSLERLKGILQELDQQDSEHPDTWLQHESGWSLTAFESGRLVWENVEEDAPPQHMLRVPREKVLQLWIRLSEGDVPTINKEPWVEGYGY